MLFNTFISFSYTDSNIRLKNLIVNTLSNNSLTFDYSEKEDRSNFSDQNIWINLEKRIKRSSITILLYTDDLLYENKYKLLQGNSFNESGWIYKELSCSLRDWEQNRINGLLIIDCTSNRNIKNLLYSNQLDILSCNINNVYGRREVGMRIDNSKYNMNDSYIVVCTLEEFSSNPRLYLNMSYEKREIQINYKCFKITYNLHNKY